MLLECGIINYQIIIPFIYPFFYQIRRVIHRDDKKPFYEFFTNYCGYLFSGLVYLIITSRMKGLISSDSELKKSETLLELREMDTIETKSHPSSRKNSNKVKSANTFRFENQLSIEIIKRKSKKTREKYLYILLLACIYLIPMFLDSYCSSNEDISFKTSSSMSLFFCIISYVVLSRIILGDKIYRHQVFSLIIIIVCNVISIILILIWEDNSNLWVNMILMFVILSLYALYNVLEKKYFNKYMDSPYHLMFVIGLISLIIILLYETITVLAFGNDRNFNGIFYQIKYNFENIKLYPLLFIGDVLSAFLWVGGIHLTVYFFTPCHFIISESVSQILSTLINNSLKDHPVYIKSIVYILFSIILIAALIYNEVIIIKAFSLEKNTKKHIYNRAQSHKDIVFDEEDAGRKSDIIEGSDL